MREGLVTQKNGPCATRFEYLGKMYYLWGVF